MSENAPATQPIHSKTLLRIAMVLILILAILAGYYKTQYDVWKTNHIKALEKFNVYTTKELMELPVPTVLSTPKPSTQKESK